MALAHFLEQNKLKSRCEIIFFYHGYMPFQNENIYSLVDEMVLLTYKSYQVIKKNVSVFPCKFSVLHNGIDTSKFFKLASIERTNLKMQLNITSKNVFLWCSQDRPKKGLHIVIEAWKKLYERHKDIELLVIGTDTTQLVDGVYFLGRIPNDKIANYYQIADVYLFPTLCQEGFGMSLVEALHCGCYCIASNLGGVSEVLANGKYGKLIENPNFSDEWLEEMRAFLLTNTSYPKIPDSLYSKKNWIKGMNDIINHKKISDNKRQLNVIQNLDL
jgi:glycosyltransferase involved in cell wall biosynthesis